MNTTLEKFFKDNLIASDGNVEYHLVDHCDHEEWADTEHFPGFSGTYLVEKNNLQIVDEDNKVFNIDLETCGEEQGEDTPGGFGFAFVDRVTNQRIKLVF